MIEAVEGGLYPISEALDMLTSFMTKRVRQVSSYRGRLSISYALQIPVQMFTKSSWQRIPSAHKYSPDGKIARNLYYTDQDSAGTSAGKLIRKSVLLIW